MKVFMIKSSIYFKLVLLLACSGSMPILAMTEIAQSEQENAQQNQALAEQEHEVTQPENKDSLQDLYLTKNNPANAKKRKLKKQNSTLNNIALGGAAVAGIAALGGLAVHLMDDRDFRNDHRCQEYIQHPENFKNAPAAVKIAYAKTGFKSTVSAAVNPPLPGLPSRILGFYRNEIGVPADDRDESRLMTHQDVIDELSKNNAFNSTLFEGSHHFIQWLFPSYQVGHNPGVETWTDATVAEFKIDPILMRRIIKSFKVVVQGYYKLNVIITRKENNRTLDVLTVSINEDLFDQTIAALTINWGHNLLRITRIIKCLKILGLKNYATAFNKCLQDVCLKLNLERNDHSLDEAANIWDLAAQ